MKSINVNYYPQDPLISNLSRTSIEIENLNPGPSSDKIEIKNNNITAEPDSDSNMIYSPEDNRFTQVQAFAVTHQALTRFEKKLQKSIKWPMMKQKITIYPEKDCYLDAYYCKTDCSLNFTKNFQENMLKDIYTARSTEVVSHELGHAILDSLRPEYATTFSYETKAFHESFADIFAIFDSLSRPEVLSKLEAETSGDLSKPNIVSHIAEEVGKALYEKKDHYYLRNAVNDLKWSDPDKLPSYSKDDAILAREPHSLSRVFTAAFYDLINYIYKENQNNGMNFIDAITDAKENVMTLIIKTVDRLPESVFFFKEIYRTILKTDADINNRKYTELIKKVFTERKITDRKLADDDKYDYELNDNKISEKYILSDHKSGKIISNTYLKEIKLDDKKFGKFKNFNIDVYLDKNDIIESENIFKEKNICSNNELKINASKNYIKYLIDNDKILLIPRNKKINIPYDLLKKDGSLYEAYTVFDKGMMKIINSPIIV